MKGTKRFFIGLSCVVMVFMLFSTATSATAYAASSISKVNIRIEKNDWGQTSGNPAVTVSGTGYYIPYGGVYWESNVAYCEPGDFVYVTVTISPKSGYFFKSSLKKSSFTVTNGEYDSFEYLDDGSISVTLLYQVRGYAYSPSDLYWEENGVARWSKVSNKVNYTIRLCKNGNSGKVIAENISDNYYDLSSWLLSSDYYWEDVTFKVKAVPKAKYSGVLRDSEYVESDEFYYWDELDFYNSGCTPTPNVTPSNKYSTDGWKFIDGNWYYYWQGSYLAGKFYVIDGKAYGFRDDGSMITGWYLTREGYWYFFENSGAMLKNTWHWDGTNWYFLCEDGRRVTGWLDWNNKTYYLNSSGMMLTGWQRIDGSWYYFDSDGVLAKDTSIQSADGKNYYYLQKDGRLLTGWIKSGYFWKYVDPETGCYVTGNKLIDGRWYSFDSNGTLIN